MRNKTEWQPPRQGDKLPNEVSAYTVAVGNFTLNPFMRKRQKQAVDYIQALEGFLGFYPCYPYGTLCIFKTENDAKGARNKMRHKGIEVGKNIGEIYIDKMYIEQAEKGARNER